MLKQVLGLILLISSVTVKAQDPTSYPDVVAINPPIITLSNLYTGKGVGNGFFPSGDERNIQWSVKDVVWKNNHYVQFQLLNAQANQCLSNRTFSRSSCKNLDTTTFTLIPMDTGAFVLQTSQDSRCLVSRDSFQYGLEECLNNKPVDLPFLWQLRAPFSTKAKLLKVPT